MTEAKILLPDWPTFERDYIDSGVPQLILVRRSPMVAVFVDQGADRLGARFEPLGMRADAAPVAFAQIHVDEVIRDDRRQIEIWTDARQLFDNFYRLISEIAADVVDRGRDPDVALNEATARWEALLSRPSLMSEETQAGLFGELWVLERLIRSHGTDAVDAWVGPLRQAHDFRVGDVELEVKTTSGAKRIHMINGLGQLQPSVGCSLHLVSLKLANAGAGGRTLPESVNAVEGLLAHSQQSLQRFRRVLAAVGYDPADAVLYPRRRRLRDAAAVIPVTDGVPRLTEEALSQIDAGFVPTRITAVVYSIDVEGLGYADGSDAFHAVLPPAPTRPETPDV